MNRTTFYYKNHRGVTELRTIEPISLQYVASPHLEYGYAPGWFLHGLDFTERDGVARKGEPRSFSLDHIQMEGFKYGTKGGAAAFHLMLQPGFVPVERAIPEVVLNSETGNEPVPSHGGMAQAVYWTLHVNGELIESRSARFPWSTDPAKRQEKTKIEHCPIDLKMLFDALRKALENPDDRQERNEHAGDALAYAMQTTNSREQGEFCDGVTVSAVPVDAPTGGEAQGLTITGRLRNASKGPYFPGDKDVLTGEVYGHTTFGEGQVIHTSPIVESLGDGLFKTKSGSIYKVETWSADHVKRGMKEKGYDISEEQAKHMGENPRPRSAVDEILKK